MGRKSKGQKTPSFGMAAEKPRSSKAKRMESYEDTLEGGGVDDFMFKRDQIMFNPRDEEEDDDIVDDGEEVMSIKKRQRPVEDEIEEEEEEEEEEVLPKKRKDKTKADVSGKGRFGKPVVDSDEEEESGSSGSSSEEEEGWGRQYYSVPSTRREKEKEGEYDEKREEERELEEREVRRLQRKAREALKGEDYGLEDEEVDIPDEKREEETVVPVPESTDPAVLLRWMEVHEPVKLALAREWPLVVAKLEKTQKGMQALEADQDGQLHKGLGWLHYRKSKLSQLTEETLLSYASTLAFFIHLTALPPAQRPDLSSHPILTRLLELKKGLSDLEELDFDAASNSDEDPLGSNGWATDEEEGDMEEGDLEEEELLQLIKDKKDLMAELMNGEEDEDWKDAGLEDGELDDLMADAGERKPKKSKKKEKKSKKSTPESFPTLAEPAFFSSKSKSTPVDDEYDLGDPTALLDADAEDKDRRKRSLAFHTSKIASTANRRAAARDKRMGGDEDIPYRDRQAARDAALRKQTRGGEEAEPLSLRDMTDGEKKRARDVRDEGDEDEGEDDGYYDLIKRRKTAAKADKVARHEAGEAERLESLREIDRAAGEGPRSLTRAIEKNKGLTPRRSKAGRNPRVKKRLAYEKAKQKVGSQRAVFKGGQASLGGKYAGEKTGISTVVKSRQF